MATSCRWTSCARAAPVPTRRTPASCASIPQFSDTFSTLIGLYASHEESDALSRQTLVPAARTANTFSERSGDTYSIFATGLWRFARRLGAVGGRARR